MNRDMAGLVNSADLNGEFNAALAALLEARTVVLSIERVNLHASAAMRANRARLPDNAFEVFDCGCFVVKVGCGKNGHKDLIDLMRIYYPL
jgi:hypothetical protein